MGYLGPACLQATPVDSVRHCFCTTAELDEIVDNFRDKLESISHATQFRPQA
jgi:hypothetical protein